MAELKERVSTLEHALGSFMIQTEKAITSLSREIQSLSLEMKDFKDEMKEFKDEMKDFKNEMKEFKDEMKDFKDEMKEFKIEMKDFKDEMRKERLDMNKKWGELSNKLGSIAEDIAAPGLLGVVRRYFLKDPDKRMDTIYIRNIKDKDETREFDAVAITPEYFFLCEIKSTPRNDSVKDFISLIKNEKIYEYFPEYQHLTLVPIFSSFELPSNVVKNLTKNKILAMAMGEEHMEILNQEVLKAWFDRGC
jgi:chromosome segregation ATPase